MTLVLSCIAHDYVVQVSDRRLVDGPSGRLLTDEQNKVTIFNGRWAIAYTGLAKLGTESTDLWLSRTLGELPIGSTLEPLVRASDQCFSKLTWPKQLLKHAFVAAGWGTAPDGQLAPGQVVVSNAMQANGTWLQVPNAGFAIDSYCLKPGDPYFLAPPVGAAVRADLLRTLNRNLRRVLARRLPPTAVAMLLASCMREAAASNAAIGLDLLCVIAPRPEQPLKSAVSTPLPDRPIRHEGTVCYWMPEKSKDLRWVLPNIVNGGWVVTAPRLDQDGDDWAFGFAVRRRGAGSLRISLSGKEEEVTLVVPESGIPNLIGPDGAAVKLGKFHLPP